MKGDPTKLGFSTRAIHAGQPPEPHTGAVAVPIYQTSTYVHEALGKDKGYDYSRAVNPTRGALEENLASLEGGGRGVAFSSGMAGISALMTLVPADGHAVFSNDVYGGTYRLVNKVLDRYRVRAAWVDTSNLAEGEAALEPDTKLLFIESPTNPLMVVSDIAQAAELAHRVGAKVAVDKTFLSPYIQRPLELGADIVMHSTTKYLNGHSDSIGGALITRTEEDGEWFAFVQKSAGGVMGPFDAFLTMRGIKTLALRMQRHEENARAVAAFL